MSSRRARLLRAATSYYIKRLDVVHADIGKVRKRLDFFGRLFLKARRVDVEETTIAGLHAEWHRPGNARSGKVMLYIHGGAFVLGSCKSHRRLVTHLARAGGIEAVVPEYRLAPENPFPAGLDDVVEAYRALLEKGYDAKDIVVAGDSAGGGLSVSMMLALKDAGDPLPGAAVLLSPFLDLTASGESMKTRVDKDPWFDPAEIGAVVRYYCSGEDLENPLLSPVFADVAGLPPTLIHVGDDEILLSDSTQLADKLRAARIPVQLEVFSQMWHVFHLFVGKMPEARAAIDKIGTYVRGHFH